MSAAPIGHRAISASAGSGKTYQLAHRFIELMARGVAADRIIALTFSRKAAGEIFDSVVRYLCGAASSPEAAQRTAVAINRPGMLPQDFLRLLRHLLAGLHRLHIGTLDSFTVGVARAFPLELGIPPGFQLLGDEGAAGGVLQEVLAMVFRQGRVPRQGPGDLELAYQQATFGREPREPGTSLEELIGQMRGHYRVLADDGAWGREARIWGTSHPWWSDPSDVAAAAGRLLDLLRQDGLDEGAMERWRGFADAVGRHGPHSTWSSPLGYLFDKLAPDIGPLQAGDLSLTVDRRRQRLSAEECLAARALMAHIVGTEIAVALQRTRGVYRVLDLYERCYDAMMRQHGRLTFTDIQFLITAGNRSSGGAVMSRLPDAEARLYIDYRLDCQLDHWLLDEFQDTSDLQWEVLSNLADEILQDSSGQRSFFYVGDTKQAIYGWRGGNARLFDQVLDRYRGSIELSHLNASFRSCQTVVDVVNKAFGRLPAALPEGAVRLWERSWQEHRSQAGFVPARGCAALIEPVPAPGRAKPDHEDRHRVAARLLSEIDPLSKGLSTAVLVRSNRVGEQIVDCLRRECAGMRIIHEGRAFIQDNPVVSVLRSLVQFAAHPGDTFAWRHLQMSPLRHYLAGRRLDRHHLPLELLREVQSSGFRSLIRQWGARLEEASGLDGFGRKRLQEMTRAAVEFDETGDRDCSSFLRFIDSYEVHDLAASEAVRVMTIHQSKGLEFDIVILPDLQSGNMARADHQDFVLARDPLNGRPAWALQMPRRAVAEADEVLKRELDTADETAAFDALCLLYVAMTRARQGLYMITSFQGKSARAFTPAAFLKQQLTGDPRRVEGRPLRIGAEEAVCLYEAGNPQWHSTGPPQRRAPAPAMADRPPQATTPTLLPADYGRRPSLRRRLAHVQPSKGPGSVQSAGRLFEPGARDALDLGSAVHQLFQRVEWAEEVDTESLIAQWAQSSPLPESLKRQAAGLFRQALAAPQICSVLARPKGAADLWREKRFEAVVDNRWISGTFDRVVVSKDRSGKPAGAAVIDFKTDEVAREAGLDEMARQYRPQMEAYRSAVSQMLRVPLITVSGTLVFVRAGRARVLGRR